jgi:mRNA interferase MazF
VRRGEIYRLHLPREAKGHEQQGTRYGVVVQADALLGLSTVLVAPTSTRARPASFRPEVEIGGTRTRVLVEQLGAVDQSRIGRSAGVLDAAEQADVDEALGVVLGLFATR